MVTLISSQCPARCLVDRVVDDLVHQVVQPGAVWVSPMYIPGRLRTASRPFRIWMLELS